MREIIPGILEKEWGEIEKKIELVRPFARAIHIDLLDGKFAENTTFLDPSPFHKYTKDIFFEVHLMVEEPEQYIEPFAKNGFQRFIGHVEKMQDQASFVARGELFGEVGLALDVPTSIDAIKVSFEDLDFITVMTVKAGFSEQEFQKEMLEKCKALREKTSLPLQIDGGVNDVTLPLAHSCGVTRFVTTSYIYKEGNPKERFMRLSSVNAESQIS